MSDTTAPTFAGLVAATAIGNAVYLTWAAASDDTDAPGSIVYKIFRATTMGGENYASVLATTAAGQLSYLDTGLSPNTYYYVVRAQDSAGNRETNTVEHSVVSPLSTGGASPVIGNYQPAVNSAIQATTPIQFDVTDDEGNFRRIFVEVLFSDSTGGGEIVHDGDSFRALYAAGSSRSVITNGFRYLVRRSGGWPGTPFFRVYAIDHAGNETDSL